MTLIRLLPYKSIFNPGTSQNEKKLSIKIKSQLPFCEGTKLKLKLIAIKDNNYVMSNIFPIKTCKTLDKSTTYVKLDIINPNIPLPLNVVQILTIINECVPQKEMGIALEYCFVLTIECPDCKLNCTIPLCVRYISSDCIVDVKCEKLEFVETPDETHQIKVICLDDCCNQTVYYTNLIHCVTHGQAPRPILFYYVNE